MTDNLVEIHTAALSGMLRGPKTFAKWIQLAAEDDFPGADLSEQSFESQIAKPESGLTALWERKLTEWDFEERPTWSSSAARTEERRSDQYRLLGFGEALCKTLTHTIEISKEPRPAVVSEKFTHWYTKERAAARSFYWPAYEHTLRAKGWSAAAIAGLDQASSAVVERLTDPEQEEQRQAKGLVVGYVQSGKTANFTGVTAKAIDAGYRLVIVLAGTLNLLRAQTQRRLDMELIGQENILRGADPGDLDTLVGIDYVGDDEDWPKFVSHGGRPSALGAFDIERLTTRSDDYKSLFQGIRALEFEKREPKIPLYDPRNLHRAAARVMVVKKNKSVLAKLVTDLKQIQSLLGEIPVLIIDDESDQASVNTSNPTKWESGQTNRTTINGLISQLLRLLPRAQYVGYTATPFANVFIDPSDAEDIFPRDFLISLPRPTNYMGVQDFHDLNPGGTAEETHVRSICEDTGDLLQEAMDAYVLSGALKLYRAERDVDDGPFRHHTMLVHESVKMDDHAELAQRITTMWHQAAYTGQEGHDRLAALLATDFSRYVSKALPTPDSYAGLKPYVSRARQLINRGGHPVIVVNGDTDSYFSSVGLDFDRTPNVWKILVGGTKLSRGFTVEGLTITYYRRTTRQADTLMQMGRWFGFRPGYRDLVRLYVGREELLTKTKTVDLYEAFEAICRDEENFRSQLSQYAELVDGEPQVTPAQIPPLVSQHLQWLKPSGSNKMYNAEVVEIRSPGQWVEPTAYPTSADDLRHNTETWLPSLESLSADVIAFVTLSDTDRGNFTSYPARATVLNHDKLLAVMSALTWGRPDLFAPHLAYLKDASDAGCATDDWALILPQTSGKTSVAAKFGASQPLTLVERSRNGRGVFNRVSGVAHRQSAERIAGLRLPTDDDPFATQFHQPRRGAVLLYLVAEPGLGAPGEVLPAGTADPAKIIVAASFIPAAAPTALRQPMVRFRTIDSAQQGKAIIEAI
ncbi:Z1 domain-containing protein [Streptomyces sp. NBC_00370]|uniref:Z1 domain-containing protein n=1 Tax=Streptomyces sp. NBC_00370 TaxID=2975728 RepID=UPI002E2732B8